MIDISIVMNFHAEGIIALPSLKSALQSKVYAESKGLKVELIAILDCPTQDSIQFVNAHKAFFSRIYYVQYGDPGLSKNEGARNARGEYLAFLDADDLFSKQWLYKAYRAVMKNGNTIAHPEANLFFGETQFIFRHRLQGEFDTYLSLLDGNQWTALSFSKRSVYLENPYKESSLDSGYGYEDWLWNCDTLSFGINHFIIKDTVHFIRMKRAGSQNRKANNNNCVIRKTALSKVSPYFRQESEVIRLSEKNCLAINTSLRSLINKKLDEVRHFDPLLKRINVKKIPIVFGQPNNGIGELIAKAIIHLGGYPVKLVILDKVTKDDLTQYKDGDKRTLLIVPSKRKITQFVQYDNMLIMKCAINFCEELLCQLIITIIVQYQPSYVINVGSRAADLVFEKYPNLVQENSSIELKVMHRHLANVIWPFVGYPNYSSKLNKIHFEDSKAKINFKKYYNSLS